MLDVLHGLRESTYGYITNTYGYRGRHNKAETVNTNRTTQQNWFTVKFSFFQEYYVCSFKTGGL